MRRPHNVDRVNGHWIIYDATGCAFRATGGRGSLWTARPSLWTTRPSHPTSAEDRRVFTAETLTALAAKVGASSRT